MPSIRVNKNLNDQMYFVTFTVKNWYYVLDRWDRWDILANCLRYFTKNKMLKIYGYVFMINHIHLIVQSPDVSGFIRDFKKYTRRKIRENMAETEPKSLLLFENPDGKFVFWKKTNMPVLIEGEEFFLQKLNYTHNNPVKRRYVRQAQDWLWSSALDYECDETGIVPVSKL